MTGDYTNGTECGGSPSMAIFYTLGYCNNGVKYDVSLMIQKEKKKKVTRKGKNK